MLVTHRDVLVDLAGDQAVCHGLVHTEVKKDGETIAWWARATTVLRRADDGRWMVTLEHVSVPFHMDGSFRAALDLQA